MPRKARLWEPGDLLHVVGRAHEGRSIFASPHDREHFVDRMGRVLARTGTALFGWSLPVNHYHLLVRVGDTPPGEVFRCLNTPLAQRERRRRGDYGAIFQGRYFSRQCLGEGSVSAALTYVLGNPVHHNSVPSAEDLECYPWSGYAELLGLAARGLVDVGATLSLFHEDPVVARGLLRRAMRQRVALWKNGARDGEPEGGGLPRVPARVGAEPPPATLGLINTVHDMRLDRRARLRAAGWRPAELLVPVCTQFGASPERLVQGGRERPETHARSVIAFIACDAAGETNQAVAALTGVTVPAIVRARRRGRALVERLRWTADEVLSWRTGDGPDF